MRIKKYISLLFILFACTATTLQAQEKEHIVLISTNKGDMKVKLYNDTPRHRDYFLNLVKKGYFDDTLFGRVIQQFIIQGGSQDSRGVKPGSRVGDGDRTMEIPNEIRADHVPKKGALACPRRDEKFNPKKDSDMSMFFIIEGRPYTNGELDTLELIKNVPIKKQVRAKLYQPLKAELDSVKRANPREFNKRVAELNHRIDSITRATPGSLTFTPAEREAYTTVGGSLHLKNEYTIFGEVISGLDVIEKISSIPTDGNDRPREDVVMKVKLLE
ncbi:MAG: peptidylprolyl isomerase [Bacteroidales bacterium]